MKEGNAKAEVDNRDSMEPQKYNCSLITEMQEKITNVITLKAKTIEEKAASNGNVYQKIYCRDISGTEITVMNWNREQRMTVDLDQYPFAVKTEIYPEGSKDGTMYYKLCSFEILKDENLDMFEPENHVDLKKVLNI